MVLADVVVKGAKLVEEPVVGDVLVESDEPFATIAQTIPHATSRTAVDQRLSIRVDDSKITCLPNL
jgi:hypothetical protein